MYTRGWGVCEPELGGGGLRNLFFAERAAEGIVPKPLDAKQVAELVELMKNPPAGEEAALKELLATRVPPGVDEAAYVKASFLAAIVDGSVTSPLVSKLEAVQLLGTMQVSRLRGKPLRVVRETQRRSTRAGELARSTRGVLVSYALEFSRLLLPPPLIVRSGTRLQSCAVLRSVPQCGAHRYRVGTTSARWWKRWTRPSCSRRRPSS
jgi:hypothetical protein